MSTATSGRNKNTIYYVHIAIFLLITFGVGFLPPFAQITPVGMRVLGAFLGAVYGWLFIALDWPSLIALLALGISGYAATTHELFISGWTFQSVSQSLLAYLFAAAIAQTEFTSYIANKLMTIKIFNGRPYVLMFGILVAAEIMFILQCGLAGLFLLWSLCSTIAQKAGYDKQNKFSMIMVPSIVITFVWANFILPFAPGSIVQINFFSKGMAAIDPNISVSFLGWIAWWLIFTNAYIVLWVLCTKFIFRIKYPEIAAVGAELASIGDSKQKMTFEQKFGLFLLVFFIVGMFIPNILPGEWGFTQIFSRLGLTGMLCLVLCIFCAYKKKDGSLFTSMQQLSGGIVWNIIWLLVATEPLANAFNADSCGIMASIMTAVTPIITSLSPLLFLVITLIVLGLITQVVHNFVLMVVFIPMLCPIYAQMGGNPYVLFFGLIVCLNAALTTPAASYTSALMFGEPSMETKHAYVQGFAHFVFSLIVFFAIGVPIANILF